MALLPSENCDPTNTKGAGLFGRGLSVRPMQCHSAQSEHTLSPQIFEDVTTEKRFSLEK